MKGIDGLKVGATDGTEEGDSIVNGCEGSNVGTVGTVARGASPGESRDKD